MKKIIMGFAILAFSLLGTGSASAADLYPWNNHADPFSFLFGNDIDTHQQTQLIKKDGLSGYFYIHFTGVVTKDGYRVARHVDCNAMPYPSDYCTVGWRLDGKPAEATFLYEVAPDHPVFLVSRLDIPEPGAYAHFHWLGAGLLSPGDNKSGYLLQLTAVDTFCFIHDTAGNATSKLSCRDNGGVAVNLGIDIATHLNIVTSFPH